MNVAWKGNLDSFNAFVSDHGHLPRHRSRDITERRLERWQSEQRRRYFGGLGKPLSEEQRTLLEGSPMLLDRAADARWNQQFAQVEEFVAEAGRYPSHHSPQPDERSLAAWRYAQHVKANGGELRGRAQLTTEQLRRLRSTSWFQPAGLLAGRG